MAKEIRIVINDDDSGLEKRFSSLEAAISKKNDNSFLLGEIRDLRKAVNERKDEDESMMCSKMKMLDDRLSSTFKMVSNRIDSMSSKLDDDRRGEIKDLIANNSKILVSKIEEGKNNHKEMMNKKMDAMENMLEQALSIRPNVNNYVTNVSRGTSYMPYVA